MPRTRETAIVSVAAIRRAKGDEPVRILFNERQSLFAFPAKGAAAEEAVALLRNALKAGAPVKAALDSRRGLLHRVAVPLKREVAEFQRTRVLLEEPDKTMPVDVAAIDPTTFNLVDKVLKARCFRLCRRIVPDYATARKIFDYCAAQSCSLPGPYGINHCIPFQYVRDGCYARAHKMRWIITTKFRYCCEKVFSFANHGNDTLAVQATKWGGCCVFWWYHVAPLIRVRVRGWFTLAMVIDPGMFDKPVLLSTWLMAQENTACSANAHVSMYSIQPGSAYWPANYAGTLFGTDPNYTQTDSTLVAYQNLTTC